MIRLLAPYLIGAAVLATLIGGAVVYGYQIAVERREAQDAKDRLKTIDNVKDLKDDAQNTDDDALADSISDVR